MPPLYSTGALDPQIAVVRQMLEPLGTSVGTPGLVSSAWTSRNCGPQRKVVGKSARQLSVLRARLIDKGIIESLRYGELVFTMPGFEAFVLEQERPAG